MKKIIPYGKQYIDANDINLVSKALKEEKITTGTFVKKFENKLVKFFKCKYSISCNSGTAAIHMALKAINCKEGDNIIMPSVNFISSYNLSELLKLKIHLADIDSSTGQITQKTIDECIKRNNLKNIKAIIIMYMGGYTYNIPEIYKFKKKLNCYIIEDACHALGASYIYKKKKFMVGSCKHADISTFSLHPLKSITSGEGGILTTNKKIFYKNALGFKSHNLVKNYYKHWLYNIKEIGLNYRLSDINCALALSQLQKVDSFILKRKEIYLRYVSLFEKFNIKNLDYLKFDKSSNPSFHLFIIFVDFSKIKKKKEDLINFLKKNDIVAQYHYIPIYKFDIFKRKNKSMISNFDGSEKYYKTAISLPIYYELTINQQYKVVNMINKFLK